MDFIANTPFEVKKMLEVAGASSVDELFSHIPAEFRNKKMSLQNGMAEADVITHLENLASKNQAVGGYTSFLGGGAYEHYIPSVVDAVISRSEFYTAYTPYQPEASQGMLQAIFEYQSMICRLTGMDVSNASLYDGASALAEAVIIALNHTKLKKIIVSEAVNPQYKQTLKTYLQGRDVEIIGIPASAGGITDFGELSKFLDSSTACVVLQNPNFFGVVEPVSEIAKIKQKSQNALLAAAVNPISLGILTPPSEYGADIVVGEAQVLGNPLNYGGPYLGFMAVKEALAWKMPGRIVGMTKDKNNKDCFVLTLQTREQHIKREKASSNICSNQALNALAASVYMSALGREGIRDVGIKNISACDYLIKAVKGINGFSLPHSNSPHFNEFVLKCDMPSAKVIDYMLENKILPGIKLDNFYPGYQNCILVAATETKTKSELDKFADALKSSAAC